MLISNVFVVVGFCGDFKVPVSLVVVVLVLVILFFLLVVLLCLLVVVLGLFVVVLCMVAVILCWSFQVTSGHFVCLCARNVRSLKLEAVLYGSAIFIRSELTTSPGAQMFGRAFLVYPGVSKITLLYAQIQC